MGRIVPVIYKETKCSVEDSIKGYWFQNILDDSNTKEYEGYQISQKNSRDMNIVEAQRELGIKGKLETSIFGPSLNGKVVLVLELE